MGVRLHKALGYGVTDFIPPEDWQERLNDAEETFLPELIYEAGERVVEIRKLSDDSQGHIDFILSGLVDDFDHPRYEHISAYNCVVHAPYGMGVPGTLVLVPPSAILEWYRIDNAIDYIEERRRNPEVRHPSWVMEIAEGLPPFEPGRPPPDLYGLLIWLGLHDLAPRLKQLLYVFWA